MIEKGKSVGEDTDYAMVPLLRHYEERRSYPRVATRIPVHVTTSDRQVVKATVRNISAEGVQLRCSHEASRKIHPRATQIPPGAGPLVMLHFELTPGLNKGLFAAEGRLTYMAVSKKEEIAFGVQFTRVAREHKKLLAGYLVDCMRV